MLQEFIVENDQGCVQLPVKTRDPFVIGKFAGNDQDDPAARAVLASVAVRVTAGQCRICKYQDHGAVTFTGNRQQHRGHSKVFTGFTHPFTAAFQVAWLAAASGRADHENGYRTLRNALTVIRLVLVAAGHATRLTRGFALLALRTSGLTRGFTLLTWCTTGLRHLAALLSRLTASLTLFATRGRCATGLLRLSSRLSLLRRSGSRRLTATRLLILLCLLRLLRLSCSLVCRGDHLTHRNGNGITDCFAGSRDCVARGVKCLTCLRQSSLCRSLGFSPGFCRLFRGSFFRCVGSGLGCGQGFLCGLKLCFRIFERLFRGLRFSQYFGGDFTGSCCGAVGRRAFGCRKVLLGRLFQFTHYLAGFRNSLAGGFHRLIGCLELGFR